MGPNGMGMLDSMKYIPEYNRGASAMGINSL